MVRQHGETPFGAMAGVGLVGGPAAHLRSKLMRGGGKGKGAFAVCSGPGEIVPLQSPDLPHLGLKRRGEGSARMGHRWTGKELIMDPIAPLRRWLRAVPARIV